MSTELTVVALLAAVLLALVSVLLARLSFELKPKGSDSNQKPQTYVDFKELVIESGFNTPYTEIDRLIVSPYGIFCIEMKSHVGYVFGAYDDKYWTQCKFRERVKIKNPLRQNYKHIKALESLLGERIKQPIHNIVFFSDAKLVEVTDKRVMTDRSQVRAFIASHMKPIYSPEEFGEICEILAYESTLSEDRLPIHIASLKQYFATSP